MRISDWSSDVCSSDLDLLIHLQRARCASKRRSAFLISASEFPRLRGQLPEQSAIVPLDLLAYGERRSILIPAVFRQMSQGIVKIGRASCRERVCQYVYISVVAGSLKKKKLTKTIHI